MVDETVYAATVQDDDTAMDIHPAFGIGFEPLGKTFSVQDPANLYLPQYTQKTTLAPPGNLQLTFKGFDSYATKQNHLAIAEFIAHQRLEDYDESVLIDNCRSEMMKGNAIVFGEISYLDQASNQVVGQCYRPVFYVVKPSRSTNEFLPIDVVRSYIQDTYNQAFKNAYQGENNTVSDTPSKKKFHQAINPILNKRVQRNIAIAAIVSILGGGVVYAYEKHKDNQPSTETEPSAASVKTPAEALKSMAKEPVMLVNKKGDGVEQTSTDDMANLQVATTENYLKKMGVDINKKSDLSCLE